MKIHPESKAGNVLFATLFTTGILSLFVGGYLTLVRSENRFTFRSQTWNSAIPIAEAGLEEALTQLKVTCPNLSEVNGWKKTSNGCYYKTNSFNADEYYKVGIFPPSVANEPTPVIVSQGFARVPGQTNFVSRTVRVNTKLDGPQLDGMVVVTTAFLNGNKIAVDSFNSTNSAFSTNGKYDITKRGDKALLATLSKFTNAIDVGNADVWGKVATPNGVLPKYGPNASIGNLAWHAAGKKGIQTGAYVSDVNMTVQIPTAPYVSAITPVAVSNVTTLGSGDYAVDNLSGTVVVTGKARLLVTKTFSASSLTISNVSGTASLELYCAAPSVDVSGGLNVQGPAQNFKFFGLAANPSLNWPGSTNFTAGGNGTFSAMLFAPNTALTLKGGGNNDQDFSGAALVKSVTMAGNYNFHFDEASRNALLNQYTAISWDELAVSWDTILAKNYTTKQLY